MGSLGDDVLKITKEKLLKGCLLSSIAHAIMTNIYPELSYEQSWDGNNFSMQDENGIRGTITFLDDYCIGAIRNNRGKIIYGNEAINSMIMAFPAKLVGVAQNDTLQYLLDYQNGACVPAITSIFFCDNNGLVAANGNNASLQSDFTLFRLCLLPQYEAVEAWRDYYGMNSETIRLLHELLEQKDYDLLKPIYLSNSQKRMIPGDFLNEECKESFSELNIIL